MNMMMMGMQQPRMAMRCTHSRCAAIPYNERFGFTCNGCFEKGYGSSYQCTNRCNYHMHLECVLSPPVVYHPFFQQRPFHLQRHVWPNMGISCFACGMAVKGLRYCYTDQRGSIYLHLTCVTLPPCIETDDGDRLFLKKKLVSFPCQYCERMAAVGGRTDGWAYVSADQQLACHVKCMKHMLYENWRANAQLAQIQGPWWLTPYGAGPSRPTAPTGQKRRVFWKLTKATVKLFFSFSTGDPFSAISAMSDLF